MLGSSLNIPKGYSPSLDLKETEKAIKFIKSVFQDRLADELNLARISAPLIVLRKTGVNDYLTGKEIPSGSLSQTLMRKQRSSNRLPNGRE